MSSSMADILKDYVKESIKNLVDKPSEVFVNVSISTKTIIVQISVDKSDCGKVIGKKGRTITALNIIVTAIKNTKFINDSRKVSLVVLEDETNERPSKRHGGKE